MPKLTTDQRREVRRRVRRGQSAVAIASAFGVHRSTIQRYVAAPSPARKGSKRAPPKLTRAAAPAATAPKRTGTRAPSLATRRKILNRLYQAIDTKLRLMERRMNSEISALEASAPGVADSPGLSPADH